MKNYLFLIIVLTMFVSGCSTNQNFEKEIVDKNEIKQEVTADEKMLLVLAAPSIHNEYYASAFEKIVSFQINYAKKIMGNDNVIILVDKDTKKYYEKDLPQEILLTEEMYDIWMRDFTTVNPLNPVQFKYTWASMSKAESEEVQKAFNAFADQYGIKRNKSELLLDGGNIVDNYDGKIITTTRFLKDNNLSYAEGKKALKELLNATEVAILEPDEEVLAHSDGMAMWIDDETLLVNNFEEMGAEFRKSILDELEKSFPKAKIIEVPVEYKENPKGVWEGFSSACGINLNAVVTYNNIYLPVFNMAHEQKVIKIVKENTDKNVILVNAEGVCPMGGSVRCLTWQLAQKNVGKLIKQKN